MSDEFEQKKWNETLLGFLKLLIAGFIGAGMSEYITLSKSKNLSLNDTILLSFIFLAVFLFSYLIVIIILPRIFLKNRKSEEFKKEAVTESNPTEEDRLRKIISDECDSALDGMVERNKKIKFMEADISRLDGFLQGSYLNDSVFCYTHGYFVASITLTAILIERSLKIKLVERGVQNLENMNFKCVNELCLAYGIIKNSNYENAEYIRKKRNDYIHTKLEKISWNIYEPDALELLNKSREILEEIFPKKQLTFS